MDIRTALRTGIAHLREAEVPSYTLAAELLLLHVLKRERTSLYAHPEDELASTEIEQYSHLLGRRAAGEPTQHLTGKQEFWGLEFEITPDVLIPRPETEHVVEVALDRLALRELRAGRPQKTRGDEFICADIGTGSGCLAVALAKEFPGATVYATDVSVAALNVAQSNAARNGVADRIRFLECDFRDPRDARFLAKLSLSIDSSRLDSAKFTSLFDLVVSNPPYVGKRNASGLDREVREHEPALALYGGDEGHELYGDLIGFAATYLRPGGVFVSELGYDSLPAVQPLLDSKLWTAVGVTNDLAGIPRVLAAQRLGNE
jgi:release factor glutamine methyltransferase